MPRQKSLVTAIRDLVRKEIGDAIAGLLGSTSGKKRKVRRRRGRRGPGRPPGSKNKKRRGRPAASA